MFLNLHSAFNLKQAAKFVARAVACGLLLMGNLNCSDNMFETFSNRTNDESLYYAALEDIRDADYTGAIEACSFMSTGYAAETRVKELCASAYAGRCGFKTLSMVSDLETYVDTAPPQKIIEWFMIQIASSTASDITDCDTAIDMYRELGTAAQRSDDQNATMILLTLRQMATVVNEVADGDEDNDITNNIPAFDACAVSNANANAFGLALWEFDKSLDAMSTNSMYTSLDTAVDAICAALQAIGQDICAAADPTALAASERKGGLSLIKEGFLFGVDQCGGNANLAACNCP